MILLRWRKAPGEFGHVLKIACDRGSPLGMHTHDFPEIFWIEAGPCLHRINGQEQILETGNLVFIRAQDRHQFQALGRRRFVMVNLECHPRKMEEMKTRHPTPFAAWLAPHPRLPFSLQLAGNQLEHLQQMALEFAVAVPDALHFEAFLLDLARLLLPSLPMVKGFSQAPEWLRGALLEMKRNASHAHGVPALVAASGKSPEHVARVCRATLKKTPTELVEEFRMIYAERELRLSNQSVTEIALACGYSTTAQFYRAFRRRHTRTPLAYRRWLAGAAEA